VLAALEEYLATVEAGRPLNRLEFLRRHSAIDSALRKAMEGLDFIKEIGCHLADQGSQHDAPALEPELAGGQPLGDFRILRQVGRGGMGVVYEAEQLSLGRRVALKVLPFAAALDAKQLQRFKNEAQAAAQLVHQHIVPVYGVGCERGVHYYAMQFIDGHTLASMITELRRQRRPEAGEVRSPLAPRVGQVSAPVQTGRERNPVLRAEPEGYANGDTAPVAAISTERPATRPAFFRTMASLGVQAAEALEHAHQMGVTHRDVKPGNLLIDLRGNLWITDFGLAQFQSDNRLTLTGDILGTLRYMSPEAALAKRVVVDHRTDIYSLGATLYELLTLEPVFSGEDRQELLRQIAFEEPTPPRRMNKAIPAELETIVLKALEKNPAERYGTAQELADDLERFLKDEPIRARRPSLVQRARKWARRHRPVVASAMVATAAVLAIAIVALVISLGNISAALAEKSDALGDKSRALGEKIAALEREKETRYVQQTALAGRELAAGNVGRAEELLDGCEEHFRGWEWHFLKRQRYGNAPPLQHAGTVTRVAVSPDGTQIASVSMDGTFEIRESRTGQVLHTLERQMVDNRATLIRGMAYSPNSRVLALARHDGSVRLFDASRGQSLHTLAGHKGPAWQVAFSPDSRTLASGGADRCVRLWDVTNGQSLRVFSEHPAGVRGVAFRPDGQSVLAACDDGTLKVWDKSTGRETFSFRGQLSYPAGAWFSPDAGRLAWASWDGVIKIWDTTTGKLQIDQQSNTHQCRAVVFSPDSKRIALAAFDGTLRLLNASSGREMLTIFAHPSPLTDVVFSHDGNKLASASYDHTVRIWDASPLTDDPLAAHCVTLPGHKQLASGVAFSPDSGWLASSSWDGTVKVWKCSRHAPRDEPGAHHAERDGYVLRYTLRGHSGNVVGVIFSSDKRTLATGSWDKTVKLWDLQAPIGDSLTELRTIPVQERVTAIAFSPDGRLLAIGQTTGIALHDPATGKAVAPFKRTPAPVPAVAFTHDSQRLISAGASDPAIKVWDVATEKPLFEVRHYSNPNASVAVSPDGKFIASPGRDQAAGEPDIKIWQADTGQECAKLTGHRHYVWKVTFSPDGQYLASGSWDSTIKVWDLSPLIKSGKSGESRQPVELITLRGHAGYIHGLAFSPDGRRLASASGYAGHGEIKVWDASLWEKQGERRALVP
jgi:WD40 repeat protein/serine/threonine protein kinase